MNRKKLKNILLFIALITGVLSLIPSSVYANAGGAGGGNNYSHGSCSGCSWTYSAEGVRLSLYSYDGENLGYFGSNDYCAISGTTLLSCPGTGIRSVNMAGKVAYLNGLSNFSFYGTSGDIPLRNYSTNFSCFIGGSSCSWLNVMNQTMDMFSISTVGNNNVNAVLNAVLSEFPMTSGRVTASDLGKLYITIEPAITVSNGVSKYYGTAYELSRYLNGELTDGIVEVLNYQLAESIMTEYIFGRQDSYTRHFVAADGRYLQLVNPNNSSHVLEKGWTNLTATSTYRNQNKEKITSSLGYGINVLWLGGYVPETATPSCTITESADRTRYTLNVSNPGGGTIYYDINSSASALSHYARNTTYTATYRDQSVIGKIYNSSGNEVATCSKTRSIPTCGQTCSGKTGDDLLGCAEEYCQYMSTNTSEKRTCITTCGPNAPRDPGFSSCPSTGSDNGDDTECDADTSAYKETCTRATTSTYYKTVCKDQSTISYGNSLPVTLTPGEGFGYTPILSGSKTCEMTFEANKWKFDYAAAYTTSERNTLLSILNKYNDVDQNSIWTQDLRNNYKYTSNNAEIEIEVTNSNDVGAANRKTTKTLMPDETVNLLSNEIVVSSAGSVTIPLFNSGRTTRTVFGLVKTNSSNKTSYKLPATCMTTGNGTLYDVGPNGTCDTDNDGPYYKYFTDMKIENDTYGTKVTVKKTSSTLDVDNTCYYNTGIPISCSVEEVSNDKYELRIENKNLVSNVTYGLSLEKDSLNGRLTYNGSIVNRKLYGTVAVNGHIVATCNNSDENDGDSDGSTCREEYLPTEYSEIREYCSTSWMSDTAGYASEKDCINSCSYGANTCKNNPDVDTTDLTSVTNFCSSKTNRDANGYNKATYSSPSMNEAHNIAMCINDCMDITNTCTGIACDYLYRPISLLDPFPNNRMPGANWYGKEIYITDDLLNPVLNPSGAEPEYVITLTPSAINSINRDTDDYNNRAGKNAYLDYVYEDEEEKDGEYISKFIHSSDEPNGGFRTYFSKIIER